MNKWKWYGHAAHFICGRWCRFHLATKVGKYLVSTIGEFVPQEGSMKVLAKCRNVDLYSLKGDNLEREFIKRFGFEEIGCGRKYETMVFHAGQECKESGCMCGLPSVASSELDFLGYNTAGDAASGHMKLCLKWSKKNE